MQLSKKQIIILGGAVFFLVLIIILVFASSGGSGEENRRVTLSVWGFDDAKIFDKGVKAYRVLKPNVTINYTKVSEGGYDEALLEALALGKGPDIFVVKSHSFLKNKAKLAPADPTQINLVGLRNAFPQVVEQDFASGGRIYALPLYIDTLALFYNKDFFDQSGIVFPPKTWQEFQDDVALLRKVDEFLKITRAGAAMGGSLKTIATAADILNLLMLQNGTAMVDKGLTRASFASSDKSGPGFQAFNFYLQFANLASRYYTWNDDLEEALNSFADNKVAMVFGYNSTLATIKKKNPFLNVGVAMTPQAEGGDKDVSYADYFGLGVSARSRVTKWAWDFVIYIATNKDLEKMYLKEVKKPPALKSIIAEAIKSGDPETEIFARQALTARSWPQVDGERVKGIFSEAIVNVLTGRLDASQALKQAQDQVSQLIRTKVTKNGRP